VVPPNKGPFCDHFVESFQGWLVSLFFKSFWLYSVAPFFRSNSLLTPNTKTSQRGVITGGDASFFVFVQYYTTHPRFFFMKGFLPLSLAEPDLFFFRSGILACRGCFFPLSFCPLSSDFYTFTLLRNLPPVFLVSSVVCPCLDGPPCIRFCDTRGGRTFFLSPSPHFTSFFLFPFGFDSTLFFPVSTRFPGEFFTGLLIFL